MSILHMTFLRMLFAKRRDDRRKQPIISDTALPCALFMSLPHLR